MIIHGLFIIIKPVTQEGEYMKENKMVLNVLIVGLFKFVRALLKPFLYVIISILKFIWEKLEKIKKIEQFGESVAKGLSKLGVSISEFFKKIGNVLFPVWNVFNIGAFYIWTAFVFITKPIVIVHDFLSRILPSWVKAILSMFIWGLGQLFNKQYIKALMFFALFITVIAVEINTGNYGHEYDFFGEEISGEEADEEFAEGFIEYYFFNYDIDNNPLAFTGNDYLDPTFLYLIADSNDVYFDETSIWYYNEISYSNEVSNQDVVYIPLMFEIADEHGMYFNKETLTLYQEIVYDTAVDTDNGLVLLDGIASEFGIYFDSESELFYIDSEFVNEVDFSNINPILLKDYTRENDFFYDNETEWFYLNASFNQSLSDQDIKELEFVKQIARDFDVFYDSETIAFYYDTTYANPISQSDFLKFTFSVDDLYAFIGAELRSVEEETTDVLQLVLDATLLAEADITANSEDDLFQQAKSLAQQNFVEYETLRESIIEELAEAEMPLNYSGTLEDYIAENIDDLATRADTQIFNAKKEEIRDEYYQTIYEGNYQQNFSYRYNFHYNQGYGTIVTGLNDGVRAFDDYIYNKFANDQLSQVGIKDNLDANKMLLRIYYEYRPEEFAVLLDTLNNPFYEQGGFFVKGVWGVTTLGSVPQTSLKTQQDTLQFLLPNTGARALDTMFMEVLGHNSTQLLLEGIISLIVIFYLSFVWIWNIVDAFKTGAFYKKAKQWINEKEYYSELYENFFEYIVLTPALLLISFISIMPIFFGLAVAFTNFAAIPGDIHIPPGQLIDWVGLRNFRMVFNVTSGSGIDFAGNFWSVFSWTLIWAVAATFTCFFGGFIQAVIISNKRVVFRKFWRSVLILPWAVPALISQMIFRVMFDDIGFVNTTLQKIGVTRFFTDLQIFGLDFIGPSHIEATQMNGFQKFFYMGEDTFQWMSNEANPWFVRIFIIILNIWLGFPFFMALMSGVMTSIDKSLYEAASIDGATGFQQFRFITMPLVLFATSPLLVMTFSGNFNNFGVIYFITGGGPGGGSVDTAFAGSTDILISWIYKLTTDTSIRWYNMASVFSILIFIIIGSIGAWNFTRTRAFREGD